MVWFCSWVTPALKGCFGERRQWASSSAGATGAGVAQRTRSYPTRKPAVVEHQHRNTAQDEGLWAARCVRVPQSSRIAVSAQIGAENEAFFYRHCKESITSADHAR